MRRVVVLLLICLCTVRPPSTMAQACAAESEPNDTPEQAQPIIDCMAGQLEQGDQDVFVFTVEPSDERRFFRLELEGVPNTLTIAEIFRSQPGDSRLQRLSSVRTPNGGSASKDSIMLVPGTYLLGVAVSSGVGEYSISIRATGDLPAEYDVEPNDNAQTGAPVEGLFDLSGSFGHDGDSQDWLLWTPTAIAPHQRWRLSAQMGLTTPLELQLQDTRSTVLARVEANEWGEATLYDLELNDETYIIRLNGRVEGISPYRISTEIVDIPVSIYESEPNNDPQHASTWSIAEPINGRLGALRDADKFRFVVDETRAAQKWDIRVDSNSRHERRLCLENVDSSVPNHCRTARGTVALVDLVLPTGEYILDVRGDTDPGELYTLSSRVTGVSEPGVESEPNDAFQRVFPLDETFRARGRFDDVEGAEKDIYHLLVTGAPQLWRIQVIGDGLMDLSYVNSAMQVEQTVRAINQRRLRLSNLYLLPGSHFIQVRGSSGDYNVVAVPLGPPPPGLELEPNGVLGQANRLDVGDARVGLLDEATDDDLYRFSLASEEHVILTVTPPNDGLINTLIRWGNLIVGGNNRPQVGEPFIFESILPPGDYDVRLNSSNATDSPYTILLERGDPFVNVTDREPNDQLALASPIPESLHVQGTAGTRSDHDWYALPVMTSDTALEIRSAARHDLRLFDADSNAVDGFNWDVDNPTYSGMLAAAAPQPFYLRVGGSDPYDLQLRFDGMPEPAPVQEVAADLVVTLEENTFAAHWHAGQAVSGVLRVTNHSSAPLYVLLDSHSSHHKVSVHLTETQVSLSPGADAELPLQVVAAAGLPTGDYPITLRARTTNGDQVTAAATLSADAEAAPVEQQWVWPVPESMLGGLNVAALSLGAEILTEDQAQADRQRALHDGFTAPIHGFRSDARNLPVTLTIRLAGADPIPVAGILLNPQSHGDVPNKLKDFELWLSVDGETYTQALLDRLSPLSVEQAFSLVEPTPARYAQLRLLSNHGGNTGSVELGEWKVVALPGWPLADGGLNIADPLNGGYIVYNVPQFNSAFHVASVLIPDQAAYTSNWPAGSEAEWVLGFHHDRAAQITHIEWIAVPEPPSEQLLEVSVWASIESPVGPWTPLGILTLTSDTSTLSLPEPTWVRYVRFAAPAAIENTRLTAPDAIRVWERPVDGFYWSIVGEWGHDSRTAVYEWLHSLEASPTEVSDNAGDSREQAAALHSGQPVHAQVQIGEDVDWYSINVPEDRNAVVLHLTGDPTVRVRVSFEDGDGNPLPATVEHLSPNEQAITAMAPPGETVYFYIEEPPRSIMFTWDNSGSVSPYFDTIYASLSTFIEGVTPGREVVNFLPFGGNVLLQTWNDQPAALQQVLNDYDRSDQSSDSEAALLIATDELAQREGTKAILVITDAASGSYGATAELWSAFSDVRPRIFSLHVISQLQFSGLPANEQDIMQSWASVNGGFYEATRSLADMETAFERATVWLRRPANYTLTADARYVEPPGPGTLRVLSSATGEDASSRVELLSNTSVEVIVDASWSMMDPLNGGRRIDVAKQSLLDLVDNALPEDIPLALRVFGNREGNFSCRSDLEVPLQPLDRAAVRGVIQSIIPQTNANTAIAASLLMVPEDLASASGHRIVILLTDGQETCGGDPGAVVAALRDRGVEIRINIVGFAIADEALKSQFEQWAQIGGGHYFDAGSAEELSASLQAALSVPYLVLRADGQVVATGLTDGEPVSVPAGVYTVEVLTEPITTIETVVVGGEQDVVVRIGDSTDTNGR